MVGGIATTEIEREEIRREGLRLQRSVPQWSGNDRSHRLSSRTKGVSVQRQGESTHRSRKRVGRAERVKTVPGAPVPHCSYCSLPIRRERDMSLICNAASVTRIMHTWCLKEERRDLGGRDGGDWRSAAGSLNARTKSKRQEQPSRYRSEQAAARRAASRSTT